ncbi:Gfo/Idh/MocA family oxidoreductase [bacterium]|nr:Gfo/Idh/MocA family oxidoreductase [bacterium]
MSEHEQKKSGAFNRRDFIQLGAAGLGAVAAGTALFGCSSKRTLPGQARIMTNEPMDKVRVGFVGVGMQGAGHVRNFINIDNVEVKAICDIIPEKVERMQKWVTDAGQPKPTAYTRGEQDFERMCAEEDLDLVFTATPWKWHVPICVSAMKNGKHAATEVPASVTLDESWELVETAEKYNKHCVMMENCCYDRIEMMVFNMIRKGVFGEVLHGECGYMHDLRNYKVGGLYEGDWRIKHSINRNGNLYPTHGLGPVAQAMDVNRGDQFDYLVSMSGPTRGLNAFAKEKLGADHEYAKVKYALGDINITMIKTKLGKTIYLVHDVNLPRPYSRIHILQGTNGLHQGYPSRIHVAGRSKPHRWDEGKSYLEEYDHPLWKNIGEKARGAGHGGMDYLEDYRLVQSLLKGEPMDMDVYDAAAWSVVSALTEESVANRSRSIDFPDFTRGMWKNRAPLGIIER